MNLKFLNVASFILVIIGLVLVFCFMPSQEDARKSLAELHKNCFGSVAVDGTVSKLSYSSKGDLIGELRQNRSRLMVFLRDIMVQEGDNVSIFGKASKFSNQCWVFAERVELR